MLHSSTTPMLSVWGEGGREGGAGWIESGERVERFVGPQEQNIRDHLVDQQQSVTVERWRDGNYYLFWVG